MAEPGDPNTPSEPAPGAMPGSEDAVIAAQAHDDMVGFTSVSSLTGRPRTPDRVPESPPEEEPEPARETGAVVDDLATMDVQESLFAPRPQEAPISPAPEQPAAPAPDIRDPGFDNHPPAPDVQTEPPIPAWAVETPRPAAAKPVFGRADGPVAPPEGAMSLYTIYALILFAVPTLGVAALIALVAVIGRPTPQQPLALSHHLYQKRTLWIAAIAAALGVVLIAVNLGVFVLFVLAVWVVIRGARGILKLSAGQPIARPDSWLL